MTAATTSASLDGTADTSSDQGPWQILGRTIGLPVEVRSAAQWGVQYLVPAAAAQRIVGPTGLEVTGPLPGKALVALAVCRYDDTDLDSYHEVAVSFVVRPTTPRRIRPPCSGPASSPPAPSAPTSTGCPSTRSSPVRPAGTSGATPSG